MELLLSKFMSGLGLFLGGVTSITEIVGFCCPNLLALNQKYNCCNLRLCHFSKSDIEENL